MSIFIAILAFSDPTFVDAAKLGVLAGSFAAALLGRMWGYLVMRIGWDDLR
jgi:NhaA family Na+:H+ antiporter